MIKEYKRGVDYLHSNYNKLDNKGKHDTIKQLRINELHIDNKHINNHSNKLDKIEKIYNTEVTTNTNNNISLLTAITLVLWPAVVITGYFGMNFASLGNQINSGWKGKKGSYITKDATYYVAIPSIIMGIILVGLYIKYTNLFVIQ
jgi:Mg2+ and Co2+ transporter CorA